MAKKYSRKFWFTFWALAVIFLAGWFWYCQTRFGGKDFFQTAFNLFPASQEKKNEFGAATALAEFFLQRDGIERNYLILLQNNLELRPGGGYIGSFGILKIKDGKVTDLAIHDLSNFDARIPDGIEPPYPMEKTLRIQSWKMRDSNWSPDFPTNAQKAEEFYRLGKGGEDFSGIFAITANMLTSFLKVTGPIQIEGFPGTYEDESAILALEYQVEKGYAEQGIEKGERKSVMNLLAGEILKKVENFNLSQKIQLAKIILDDLERKDIQLYFKDEKVQEMVEKNNWGGIIDAQWSKDYLMVVDANLGAYKSDYYVKRSINYSVDLSKEIPEANLLVTYHHTAKQKDWMTNDYTNYLRVYAPRQFWLTSYSPELEPPRFAEEFGKKYFGFLAYTPIGARKTFEFRYTLPQELKDDYELKIQKQAGINDVPVAVSVTYPDGSKKDYDISLNSDIILSEM
jgi:hypothetical protein